MTPEGYSGRLAEVVPQLEQDIRWLIAHWDPEGVIERGLVGLRGPTLDHWVGKVRDKLTRGDETGVEDLVGKIVKLLEGKMVLSGAAVVQCGCLHTS